MNRMTTFNYKNEIIKDRSLNAVIGVIFFVLATTLGAYVRIPLAWSPVPITLQTFFVLMAGAVLGSRLGLFSQIGYVMLGLLGLPLFQGSGFGLSALLGPTGGYLVGFLAASYVVGRSLSSRGDDKKWVAATFIMGSVIIYAIGISWLICVYHVSVKSAFIVGVLPFIPGDILKIIMATAIYSRISGRTKRIFSE